MRSPEASWPSALRATYSPPPRVAPHRPQSAAAAVGLPFSTSGVRSCRTLYTASPGAGTPSPQTPILAWPERSITGLAWTRPAAAPGSSLPSCRTYVTGPAKVATVSTEPSAVRIRATVTRGGAGAAGTASAGWLAPGRAGAVRAGAVTGVPARLDRLAGCAAVGGELQAAIAHRPAREAAVQPLRMVHSLVRRAGRREPERKARRQPEGRILFGHYVKPHRHAHRLGSDSAIPGRTRRAGHRRRRRPAA